MSVDYSVTARSWCAIIDNHRGRQKAALIYQAHELISLHFTEPLTLTSLSKQLGLNKTALTTGFREQFGVSVFDFIHQLRMQHARELLLNSADSVSRIAEAVGFGHACNFSTAFRVHFGCSPKELRSNKTTSMIVAHQTRAGDASLT